MRKTEKQKLIIVGASAPGVRLAARISASSFYDVTLIHGAPTFDFSSALYVNKSGYSRRRIILPIRRIFSTLRFKKVRLINAMVSSVEPENKQIVTSTGKKYKYDQLVMALESDARVISTKKHVFNAYSAQSMENLRSQILETVIAEEPVQDIHVIGAGKAGLEIAAEARVLLDRLLGKSLSKKTVITVYERKDSPSGNGIAVKQAKKLVNRLANLNIEIQYESGVVAIKDTSIILEDKTEVETHIVIVASGTVSHSFYAQNKEHFLLSKEGYVRCSDLFEAEGYSTIYIIGSNRLGSAHNDLGEALYDSQYLAAVLQNKREGSQLPQYEPPHHYHSLTIGKHWGVYISKKARFGLRAAIIIRWIELKHFATLLPKRYAFLLWLKGAKQDLK